MKKVLEPQGLFVILLMLLHWLLKSSQKLLLEQLILSIRVDSPAPIPVEKGPPSFPQRTHKNTELLPQSQNCLLMIRKKQSFP